MSGYPGSLPSRGRTPPPPAPANDYDQYYQYSNVNRTQVPAPPHQSYPRDRSPIRQPQQQQPQMACPTCHTGLLEVLVSNSEQNAGKRYWKCNDCDNSGGNGWKGWANKPPIDTKPSKKDKQAASAAPDPATSDKLDWIAGEVAKMSSDVTNLMFTMREILEQQRHSRQ